MRVHRVLSKKPGCDFSKSFYLCVLLVLHSTVVHMYLAKLNLQFKLMLQILFVIGILDVSIDGTVESDTVDGQACDCIFYLKDSG